MALSSVPLQQWAGLALASIALAATAAAVCAAPAGAARARAKKTYVVLYDEGASSANAAQAVQHAPGGEVDALKAVG